MNLIDLYMNSASAIPITHRCLPTQKEIFFASFVAYRLPAAESSGGWAYLIKKSRYAPHRHVGRVLSFRQIREFFENNGFCDPASEDSYVIVDAVSLPRARYLEIRAEFIRSMNRSDNSAV